MADNFNDAFNAVKNMVDSGNIPPDIQNMINNLQGRNNLNQNDLSSMLNNISPEMLNNLSTMFQSQSNSGSGLNSGSGSGYNSSFNSYSGGNSNTGYKNNSGYNGNSNNSGFNGNSNSNNFGRNGNSNNNYSNSFGSNSNSNQNFNIDMNTIMKMKKIMESMNQKNDPRANLLYSLKPYLRDTKKDKLDQYVNLLNMTKIAEVMKNEKKENNPNA